MAWIYRILSPEGKVYVGATIDINKRFNTYRAMRCKKQPLLYASFLKHGVDTHLFKVICECDWIDMHTLELYYGELLNAIGPMGLNRSLPVKTRIALLKKQKRTGLIKLKSSNFYFDKLIGLHLGQRELLRYYKNELNLNPRTVIHDSLKEYWGNYYTKFLNSIFKNDIN